MSVRIAAPSRQKVVPAFVVEAVDEKVTRTVIKFDGKGKKYEDTVKEPYGYRVSFPAKGHSIRVRTREELERLGFDQTIPLLDTRSDDDEAVGELPNSVK